MSEIEQAYAAWYENNAEEDVIEEETLFAAGWNASRAELIGEVEPVAIASMGIFDHGPIDFNPTPYGCDTLPDGKTLLYTADQLAAAHAKGREEGLREAQRLIDNTDLGALSGLPEQVWVAQMLLAYSKSIERLLKEKS